MSEVGFGISRGEFVVGCMVSTLPDTDLVLNLLICDVPKNLAPISNTDLHADLQNFFP